MSICFLVRLATERASLHHVDEAGFEFEVDLPNVDVGSSSHIGGGGDGKLFSAIASQIVGASELGFCTGKVAGGGRREVVTFSQASLDFLCSFPAGRNRSYTTPVFFSNQK